MWDHFLDYIKVAKCEWALPKRDTDEYRKERAVELFNFASVIASNICTLNMELAGWVLHVLCLIVPGQILDLGSTLRAARRRASPSASCPYDKVIKHLTSRRRIKTA
eukprot:1969947-Pleurochrysis_carterae.AAC.2